VKWTWAVSGLTGAGALLLPLLGAADSHLQSDATRSALSATAHVNFKIVIPQVLSLQMGSENHARAGATTVAIMSNSRTATLNTADRAATDSGSVTRGNVIFSTAAGRIIAEDAECAPRPIQGAAIFCTASMP
jgi:hypothetical protein